MTFGGLNIAAALEIDLVLLDLKMPGLNGQETLKELMVLRPGLPVIMMTAYPGHPLDGGLNGVSGQSCAGRWARMRPGSSCC